MCHYVAAMAERQQPGSAKTLQQLFEAEPDRLSRFTFELAGIYFDWSKTHLDAGTVAWASMAPGTRCSPAIS